MKNTGIQPRGSGMIRIDQTFCSHLPTPFLPEFGTSSPFSGIEYLEPIFGGSSLEEKYRRYRHSHSRCGRSYDTPDWIHIPHSDVKVDRLRRHGALRLDLPCLFFRLHTLRLRNLHGDFQTGGRGPFRPGSRSSTSAQSVSYREPGNRCHTDITVSGRSSGPWTLRRYPHDPSSASHQSGPALLCCGELL